MKIVLAIGTAPDSANIVKDMTYPNILVSFAYKQILADWPYEPDYFVLDSGAFTAWNVGKQVDFNEYRSFAVAVTKKWKSTRTINLDVIPGEKGRTSTKNERLAGMEKSLDNADSLRKAGLKVMEVFHQDEPIEFLYKLLDRRQEGEVLGLSPRNDVSLTMKAEWHRNVLSAIAAKYPAKQMPPCHGLAVTTDRLLRQFPYYSADSSTWVNSFRFGAALMTGKGNGVTTRHVKLVDHFGLPEGSRLGGKDNQSALAFGVRRHIESYIRLSGELESLWERRGIRFAR